jgi:hypothetical protein
VAEDDADRGALAAQPEATAPYPDWRFDVMTEAGARCGSSARRDLCGGGEQSPSLPRLCYSNGLRTTRIAVDVAWRIVSASGGIDLLQRQTGAMLNDIAAVESLAGSDASSVLSPQS